jgi:hypothetical protein
MRKTPILLLTLLILAAACGPASARPVNPAQGWLLDLGLGYGKTDLKPSKDPGISQATPWSATDFLLRDNPGVVHREHSEASSGALLGLGYGWPVFAAELLVGPRLMKVDWKEYDAVTGVHRKDFDVEAPGVAMGLLLEGTPYRSGGFSLDLDLRLLLSIHRDAKIYETNSSTGVRKDYYEANAILLKRYSASMVGSDASLGITASWTLGAFTPWLSLKARNDALALNWTNEFVIPMTWSLRDYNLKSARSFSPSLGLDWRFNRNAALRLEGDLGNPVGAWLSLSLCSGERQ